MHFSSHITMPLRDCVTEVLPAGIFTAGSNDSAPFSSGIIMTFLLAVIEIDPRVGAAVETGQ